MMMEEEARQQQEVEVKEMRDQQRMMMEEMEENQRQMLQMQKYFMTKIKSDEMTKNMEDDL